MDDNTSNNDSENLQETGAENESKNAQENHTENLPESQAQMTLENMTEEVSKIYEGFDPLKHAVNPDGTPKKRADGQWASKRGRKPGQTSVTPTVQAATSKPDAPPLSAKKARETGLITNEAAARQTVALVVTALGSTIGEEWNFETQEEADNMRAAVKAYYDAHGQVPISPEMMLSFQVFAYAAPRVKHPNTQSKLKTAWDWCLKLFGK